MGVHFAFDNNGRFYGGKERAMPRQDERTNTRERSRFDLEKVEHDNRLRTPDEKRTSICNTIFFRFED